MPVKQYSFLHALRPFSFGVALTTCLIGIAAARHEGVLIPLNAMLVLVGGLLLQAGVNLINDYSDIELLGSRPGRALLEARILSNYRVGLFCFLAATPIGLYLALDRGLELLWLFLLGLAGALGYTLKPVNYKDRGLAVVLVFWLMGVLMVCGSHIAVGGRLSVDIVLLSLPISLLVSLLLLSNELRDYESDAELGLGTLTVRIGYSRARTLFLILLALASICALALALNGLLGRPWLLLAALPFMLRPPAYLDRRAELRRPLTPATGRLVMVFGLLFSIALI